jgi:exodeoxyribonuclease V beta subunit
LKFCQVELNGEARKNRDAPRHPLFLLMEKFVGAYNKCKDLKLQQEQLQADIDSQMADYYQHRLQMMRLDLLHYVDQKFPALKSDLGIMDFDDMILNIYRVLASAKEGGRQDGRYQALAIAVAKQFRAALVDEFQDTDPLQLTIFQSLFAQTQTPLFYVGDPKQAIFGFRGADIYAYYQGSDASDYQRTLKTNFRSTPALVDSVNALFSPSHRSFISEEITFDWVAAKPKKELYIEGQPPEAMQFVITESKDQKAFSKGEIEPIAISHTVQQIADILAKADTGHAYFTSEDGQKSKVNPADIAILVPTHKQAALMAEALSKQGVMSVRQGQEKVLESDAAKTVLRLMRAVADPGVEARVTELLADPLLGLTGHEIVAMKDGGPQWESLLEDYWQLKRIWTDSGFSAMFRHWLSLPDSNGTTLAQRLVDYHDGERNLTDLMHIAEIMQQRSRQQSSIKALVSWLQYAVTGNSNEDEHQLRLESDTQRVKIVTLHAAKGLEYNIVFCPFLWQGKQGIKDEIIGAHQETQAVVDFGSDYFAEAKKQANEDQLKEQLRLLYVALTRPVHRCVIFWAHVQGGGYKFTANSALAWLLYGDDSMQDNPVEKLRGKVTKMSFAEFVAGVNDFKTQAEKRQPASITGNMAAVSCLIVKESAAAKRVKLTPEAERKLSCAAVLDRYLAPSWLQTSFSGLVGNQHASVERSAHADDVPEEGTTDEGILKQNNTTEGASQPPSIFNFPRGALPGECLHSIFEHWDFTSTDKAQLKGLIADKMNRFAISTEGQREKWYEPVAQAVFGTLQKPLNERGFCLAQIAFEDRQAELEFLLAARGTLGNIHYILANPLYQLPPAFVDASKQLNDKKIQGFLTGFIDLVFKDDQDKYHVLDWKSNYLGDQTKDYAPHHIEHAMAKTHYYLQALLYLLALHRYLRQQLPHYKIEQHLGGAWYVFVRGIDIEQSSAEPASGLYYFQPPAALILALDEQLATQEVVV